MRWISVKDELPELVGDDWYWQSESVLVFARGQQWVAYFRENGWAEDAPDRDWIVQGRDGYRLEGVTHWMPLPEPPKV